MFYRENPEEGGTDEVILGCLRKILEYQDAERFLAWARDAIPRALDPDSAELPPEEARRLAFLLARAVWNATPLPSNGFRIQRLDEPDPGAPCPCGSGRPYAPCCAQVTDAPDLPIDLMWELLLGEIDERGLEDALSSGRIPPQHLGIAAERILEADRPGRAIAMLEPLFEPESGDALDERFEYALNVLCDAYDRRNHWKKKLAFLRRMSGHSSRTLRSSAWQRLCTIYIDEGDFTAAQFAFSHAQREAPDSPGTALLEITLLASQHEDELARKRAVFWLHKLQREGGIDDGMLKFLRNAARNPQDALMTSQAAIIDPRLMLLRDWVQAMLERPLPAYGLKPLRQRSPNASERQLPLFGEHDAAGGQTPPPEVLNMARLCATAPIQRLQSLWHRLFHCPKPASTSLVPVPPEGLWESDRWVSFLVDHPDTADSLDILDDLATALYLHPESALPWISHSLLTPLLERAERIIERVLPEYADRTIPWIAEQNRPALRLLFRLHLAQMEEGKEAAAVRTLHMLLRLNPSDNHGVRAELMNYYLRRHDNDKALDLAERFPDDSLADLAYGEVLALYRLGAQTQARHALRRALSRLPRIPPYLTRKRVSQPRLNESGSPSRAEDEAWLYREAMLDVWEAEPGLLEWLKKQIRAEKAG